LSSAKKSKKAKQKPSPQTMREKQPAVKRSISRSPSPLLTGSWQFNTGIFLLLVLFTVVIYSGDLHLGFFNLDDEAYVIKDDWIKQATAANISNILTKPYFANFSPMHLLSYMVDYSIAGLNAFAFHLSSNIWAGIVAGFVYLTALAVTKNRFIAIASGILFIVHPVHVEAVAWISSRKDLVAAAFALPSFLAYLKYRKNAGSRKWYFISLFLFLLAVAGKLSVAIFPAVFFAFDLFIEKRPLIRSLIDKIPFLAIGVIFGLIVSSAQPPTGHHVDPYIIGNAFAQSFWLLLGFGSYVVYHNPPAPTEQVIFTILAIILLIGLFLVPLLFRRRFPIATVLVYWILFGFLPTQVLSFSHPVTDRYLFFPSVAAVILFAWCLSLLTKKIGGLGITIFLSILALLAIFWTKNTFSYLSEWKDPRSVWYAAQKKSTDAQIYWNMGCYYQDKADGLGTKKRTEPLSETFARDLARSIWKDSTKLEPLLSEWQKGIKAGPFENEFKTNLLNLAWNYFEKTKQTKGDRILPELYFRRGLILLDKGDLAGAKKEILISLDEGSRHSFEEAKQAALVRGHNALGILEWTAGNYPEALKWLKQAESEQIRFGKIIVPEIGSNLKQLEKIMGPQTQH
jgi:tetratricopeptide (TPR) repeat protein